MDFRIPGTWIFSPNFSHALQIEFVLINQSFPLFFMAQTRHAVVQAIKVFLLTALGAFISSFLSSFIFFLGPGMGIGAEGLLYFFMLSSACSCSSSPVSLLPEWPPAQTAGRRNTVEGKTSAQPPPVAAQMDFRVIMAVDAE